MNKKIVKKIVRDSYAKIANQDRSSCIPVDSCCGKNNLAQDISKKIGIIANTFLGSNRLKEDLRKLLCG